MQVVFKYLINLPENNNIGTVTVPEKSKIIHAGLQNTNFCVWALVDPDELTPTKEVDVIVLGTGHRMCRPLGRHLSSEMAADGRLVFHYFLAEGE